MKASGSFAWNLLQTAERYPEHCAIQDGSERLSYVQLARRAAAIADRLRSLGLAAGDRVAIALPNSAEFVAAYYGVLMAGGIAVLVNTAAKARDFRAWLEDCEAAFVFAEPGNQDMVAALEQMDSGPVPLHPGLDESQVEWVVHPVASDDPACILYTSGTTGNPKGVVLSHGNLASNTAAIVEYLGLTSEDSSVTVLPFYYSYGSSVLHTHLRVGARLVLEKNLVYPHVVVEALARERATGFAGVPSTFALLLSRVKLADHDLSSLRYVTQAGGAMPPAIVQRLREALPHSQIVIMYGQTEATARLTYLPAERLQDKLGSVGIPVPGITIEIRDESAKPVVAGEVGDIWAKGPNVMKGYWRNDAATRQVKHEGWLKTGDMGRLDEDGFLYIVGRRSDMIKAGAHRVHPQDIEEAIVEIVGVQEAAVVGIDDDLLGQTIKAFVVATESSGITPMRVQAHCRERLASYKVPKSVEFVTSLPRTSSGKVRRRELVGGTQSG
jgi:acyl-CoA synthetase (AMP-forming)/AMP-acid ligase II